MDIKLSGAEWKIMCLLWEESPRTIIQLTNLLKEETDWTKHTVISFLKRMEEKGAVHFEAGKKAKQYYPDIDKNNALLQETEDFLGKVFEGKMGLLLNTMVSSNTLSKEEITELYDIIKRAEKENNK